MEKYAKQQKKPKREKKIIRRLENVYSVFYLVHILYQTKAIRWRGVKVTCVNLT